MPKFGFLEQKRKQTRAILFLNWVKIWPESNISKILYPLQALTVTPYVSKKKHSHLQWKNTWLAENSVSHEQLQNRIFYSITFYEGKSIHRLCEIKFEASKNHSIFRMKVIFRQRFVLQTYSAELLQSCFVFSKHYALSDRRN